MFKWLCVFCMLTVPVAQAVSLRVDTRQPELSARFQEGKLSVDLQFGVHTVDSSFATVLQVERVGDIGWVALLKNQANVTQLISFSVRGVVKSRLEFRGPNTKLHVMDFFTGKYYVNVKSINTEGCRIPLTHPADWSHIIDIDSDGNLMQLGPAD